jgi:hypothetical protein
LTVAVVVLVIADLVVLTGGDIGNALDTTVLAFGQPILAESWETRIALLVDAHGVLVDLPITVVVKTVAFFNIDFEFAPVKGDPVTVLEARLASGNHTQPLFALLVGDVVKLALVGTEAAVLGISAGVTALAIAAVLQVGLVGGTDTAATYANHGRHAVVGELVELAIAVVVDEVADLAGRCLLALATVKIHLVYIEPG